MHPALWTVIYVLSFLGLSSGCIYLWRKGIDRYWRQKKDFWDSFGWPIVMTVLAACAIIFINIGLVQSAKKLRTYTPPREEFLQNVQKDKESLKPKTLDDLQSEREAKKQLELEEIKERNTKINNLTIENIKAFGNQLKENK